MTNAHVPTQCIHFSNAESEHVLYEADGWKETGNNVRYISAHEFMSELRLICPRRRRQQQQRQKPPKIAPP